MAKSKPLFSVQTICQMALLIALEIVFNRFLSINTQALKIGFAFVPIVLCAVLFGPLHAAIAYAIADTIGALLLNTVGGPYIPGITLSCAMMGIMYGVFLQPLLFSENGKLTKIQIMRIICPVAINCMVFGLALNSFWLSLAYSSRSFYYFLTTRLIEYAILIPVQIILIPLIITVAKRLRRYTVIH